ncbi:GLPGLI family protein [Lutibacter sp. A80]|jgi:GLPGLI family protein|uniref:GLPGLI family protein n=1 Tax=unclassified Lutibacter TaxID=2626258 RepID=UPI001F05FC48|nr:MULTISPECIES: GLPGLI family protein [unclassified Lutibacter]UMB52833.1 GLPGLI family protein [Lutibacter sp. A64]UMB59348.1 GLPGLI family protein [Lutibacter sp. A80]
MKKISLLTFLILLYNISFSQGIKGKAIYSLSFSESYMQNMKESKSNYVKNLAKQMAQNIAKIEVELKFLNEESIFKGIENIDISDIEYESIMGMIFSNGVKYTNLETKETLWQKEAYGQKVLLKSSLDSLKWVLVNETKQIGEFFCHKATTTRTVINSKGTFHHLIVAWYCPELPIRFGPAGYGNLPGLIIKLTEQTAIFNLRELVLNSKEKIVIKKPSKGELMTEKELLNIGFDRTNKFKKSLRN